jgi:hypothetical protein
MKITSIIQIFIIFFLCNIYIKVTIKEEMKNILAENMLRFGPRNLTESEKRNLQRLTEQSDEWENVTTGTGGGKELELKFAANSLLTHPNEGELRLGPKFANSKPLYVGALLQANYNPSNKFATQASQVAGGRFGYTLTVTLTTKKGFARDASGQFSSGAGDDRAFDLFRIVCAQSEKKQFLYMITNLQSKPAIGIDMLAYKTSHMFTAGLMNTNNIPANIDGWCGTLRNDINQSLLKYGYPALPNSIQYSGTL